MNTLHLSQLYKCKACGEPLVMEWLCYWFGDNGPRHANCEQYARVKAHTPERFGLVWHE